MEILAQFDTRVQVLIVYFIALCKQKINTWKTYQLFWAFNHHPCIAPWRKWPDTGIHIFLLIILLEIETHTHPVQLCFFFQTALKHISTAPKIHSSGFCHYWLCCVMMLRFMIIIFIIQTDFSITYFTYHIFSYSTIMT